MTKLSVILVPLFLTCGCDHRHDQKMLGELFERTRYDTSVMNHLSMYDSLRKILISNLDTILTFRDLRTPVYHSTGDTGYTTHERHDFYLFYYKWDSGGGVSGDEIGPETLPAFVYPRVRQVFEALGRDRIGAFMIWRDSTIELRLPSSYIDKRTEAAVLHQLRYKRIVDISEDAFAKDTTVAPRWTYEIRVEEYYEKER